MPAAGEQPGISSDQASGKSGWASAEHTAAANHKLVPPVCLLRLTQTGLTAPPASHAIPSINPTSFAVRCDRQQWW